MIKLSFAIGLKAFTLLIFCCLCKTDGFGRNLAVSTSQSACKSCVDNSSQKWCAPVGNTQVNGECCSSGDTSGYCASSSSYACSGSSTIQGNAGLILCPDATSKCGYTDHSLRNTTTKLSIVSSVSSTAVCTQRFYKLSGSITQVKIVMNNIYGATATVYRGPRGEGNYTMLGSLLKGYTATISFSTNTDVYLLVVPSSASNLLNITVFGAIASSSSNSSGSSSSGGDSISDGSKTNLTALWVVLGILGGIALIGGAIFAVVLIYKKNKKNASLKASQKHGSDPNKTTVHVNPNGFHNPDTVPCKLLLTVLGQPTPKTQN
ncbi:unnamed protein product [Moneuplotes crassus]|uniref:Uncharacterized protein n=1 Tax=Euplotes crassus TaxID=5936 RepID=A0AAD1UAU3_EUPCR|nr:unnamed protein product [Moneuplotes crassus]